MHVAPRCLVGTSIFVTSLMLCSAGCSSSDSDSNTASGGSGNAGTGSTNPSGGSGNSTSGGNNGTGGDSGAAGSTLPNENKALPYGFSPTTLHPSDAATAYEDWKSSQLDTSCGNGVCRVIWDTQTYTVSEGIGYGMLMAVTFNDPDTFKCLWAYYQLGAASSGNRGDGLMCWEREGCTAAKPNASYPDDAASDADLDVAMALVMADCRWGGYTSDATRIITAIQEHEVVTDSDGIYLLKPGNNPDWGGANCLDPSYFSPGYYRAFAQVVPSQATFWNKLADDSYTLLNRMANSQSGLIPNWATSAGGTSSCANNDDYGIFGWDAIRNPWRIAVDYVWWGTEAAKIYLERINTWSSSIGISTIKDEYNLDGTLWSRPSSSGRPDPSHNARATGAYASAALVHDQSMADSYFAETLADTNYGPTSSTYYPKSLRTLYLMLGTGQFTTCGNK